jgi:type I restriction enzyme S subunit
VTVPPQSEQAEIVNFLERESFQIDSLIMKAGDAVVLLKERRSSLISAAVTGKIDVRTLVN